MYDLNAALDEAEKQYNIGSGDGAFKCVEGDNKLRVLSEFAVLQTKNPFEKDPKKKDKLRTRFMFWVYNYANKKVQVAYWSQTLASNIGALQANPEYTFDSMPMPYDLIINAKNAGTIDVVYTVQAARTNTPVPQEALDQMADKEHYKPIDEVRDSILEKQAAGDTSVAADSTDTELPV